MNTVSKSLGGIKPAKVLKLWVVAGRASIARGRLRERVHSRERKGSRCHGREDSCLAHVHPGLQLDIGVHHTDNDHDNCHSARPISPKAEHQCALQQAWD
jgi:hypothetical protein